MKQELLIAGAGIVLIAIILGIARRRLLTVRYTVGWVLLAVVIIIMALLTPLIEPITDWFGMTPTGLLLLIASGTLLLICIQLSITASGLTAQQRDLTEAIVVGFALGSVLFIHRMSRATGVEARSPLVGEDMPDSMAPGARQGAAAGADPEVVVYRITGAFFFGAASSIGSVLDRIADTHRALVVD